MTPDLVVRELMADVWLHRSWGRDATGARAPANGLVVRDADGLVIVDTPWGNASTEALLDWIARELNEPVHRVIVTHAHDDRMGGARAVHARAIPLLAAPRTVEIAASRRAADLPMPLAGLDEEKAVLVGDLEIFNPGPAHAPDNVVVWLPEKRVLFAGCLARSADATSLGFSGDASLARWPEAIRRVKQRYPDVALVVPGHGEPGAATLLDRTRALLARRTASAKASPRPRAPVPERSPEPEPTPAPTPLPTLEPAVSVSEPIFDEPPVATAAPVPRILLPAEQPH